MDRNTTRKALMNNISDDLIKLEDYIRNHQENTNVSSLKDILSSAIENSRNIRYNINYASEKYLSEISSWIREWDNGNKNSKDLLIVCNKLKKNTHL